MARANGGARVTTRPGAETHQTHPSYLELDRIALGAAMPDTAAHASACATCRAYVDALAASAGAPIPSWVRAPGKARVAPRDWLRAAAARRLGVGFALLACVAVAWGVRRPMQRAGAPSAAAPYVGAKGAAPQSGPALWLYVSDGRNVRLWNGQDPVAPGDVLRLKIRGAGFNNVSVFVPIASPPGYERISRATP